MHLLLLLVTIVSASMLEHAPFIFFDASRVECVSAVCHTKLEYVVCSRHEAIWTCVSSTRTEILNPSIRCELCALANICSVHDQCYLTYEEPRSWNPPISHLIVLILLATIFACMPARGEDPEKADPVYDPLL